MLGVSAPDANIFREALEFSRFENMQKLEAAGAFDSNILHPGDVRDPESFKVRRGKVGGYREYLSADDQQFATADERADGGSAIPPEDVGRLSRSLAAISDFLTATGIVGSKRTS